MYRDYMGAFTICPLKAPAWWSKPSGLKRCKLIICTDVTLHRLIVTLTETHFYTWEG